MTKDDIEYAILSIKEWHEKYNHEDIEWQRSAMDVLGCHADVILQALNLAHEIYSGLVLLESEIGDE
jgi:hypothetical protein